MSRRKGIPAGSVACRRPQSPVLSRRRFLGAAAGAVALPGIVGADDRATVTVALDPSKRHQTFRAWETSALFDWPVPPVPRKDEVFDHLLDVIGISRVRVEVYAGDENTRNIVGDLFAGKAGPGEFRLWRYRTVNDNDDPFVLNPAGFHFDGLDWRVENVWLPLKARADARGLPLEFSLNYVAFTQQSEGGPYHHDRPEEYAEFILAAFLHLKSKYGIVPESLEMVLEPDLIPHWSPALLGAAAAAVTRRLIAEGFRPRLIVPSTTSTAAAPVWFDAVAATPGAMELVSELSFHLYREAKHKALLEIAERGRAYGIETGMLEYWLGKGTHGQLFRCLRYANISSWQSRAYLGYSNPDRSRPPGEVIGEPEDVRYNLLYFRSITRGAVRIGSQSSSERAFGTVAFVNPGDRWTVIVEASAAGRFEIGGLPAGDYWITTATQDGNRALPEPIGVGATGRLTTGIDRPGVLAVSAIPPLPRYLPLSD